ncbi:ArnT family glycosyltransferase [Notoacmeibacter ruber]|uniref:Glycosyltransferase RgtA/B/C/D-like domain-containing protein n=1 Tax=Notoacmeibacter ruber TaxID=2670375 RepID=A0A3L7JE85_9HYPH|nr:glycosyltransferase family 39 protein [Notoacmeibacter ruber]RLQ87891.1 hypothetical protein D8780_06415 [Notoacmeibacter ruber]
MIDTKSNTEQPRKSAAVLFGADWFWLLCLLLYFAALIVARVVFGGVSLNWDDAELPVAVNLYRPGYGPQLPLYHWYQNALFQLFGISIFSISLGRDLVRFASAAVMYAFARQVGRPTMAFAATLALELNIHFAWYAQRAFSHNNSAILLGLLTVFIFWLALQRPGSWFRWLAFGLVTGLGLLSKYNFLFIPFVLVVAAVSDRDLRMRLPWTKVLAAFALSAALVAFPYQWIISHLTLATGASGSLRMAADNPLMARLSGLAELAMALLSNGGLSLVLAALLMWLMPRRQTPIQGEVEEAKAAERLGRFLLRYLICFSVILFLGVLIAGIGNVRDRWLLPAFSFAGPAMVLLIWHHISDKGRAILVGVSLLIAAAVLVGHPLESRYWKDRGHAPFGSVVEGMASSGAKNGTYVVAPFQWVAGNLKHRRPDWVVDDYRLLRFSEEGDRPFLLVIDNDPKDVRQWSERFGPDYGVCPDRPDLQIDTQESEPDRRRLDLSIIWICPTGSSQSDE